MKMSRILALLMAVMMCLSLLPLGALADEELADAPAEQVEEIADSVEEDDPAEPELAQVAEPESAPEPEQAFEPEPVEGSANEESASSVEVPVEVFTEDPIIEPEDAPALDGDASGTCGENLTWKLTDDGVLTISGTGAMWDYGTISETPWKSYRSSITCVVIGDGVTSIGSYAFGSCYNMTEVSIGSAVTSIGSRAFQGCNKLTGVTIPDSMDWIGEYAFADCTKLVNADLGISVTSIGNYAFQNCSSLNSITIPDGVTHLAYSSTAPSYVFSGCTALTTVVLGSGITRIPPYLFKDCSNLTNVTFRGSVTSVGNYAFWYCYKLENVNVADLNAWWAIRFDSDNRIPNPYFLYSDGQLVTNLMIPYGVTSIGSYAYFNCASLASVTIPDSVTSIGSSAFCGCKGLTSIMIPDSVTSVGLNAFMGCSSITSVVIPDSVTSIGSSAFSGCSALTEIVIPDSVTSIGQLTFSECSSLTSVTIPDSVTSIGQYAFSYCSSLTSVTIPDSVTSIGESAFYNCTNLTSIKIPDGVTSIGEYVFTNCSSLTEIVIPDSVTSISQLAFTGCSSLTSVVIPDSVTNIGQQAFGECSNLREIIFEGNAPIIGYSAFLYVTATAYYPANDPTWTEDVRQNYGGEITWVPMAVPVFKSKTLLLSGQIGVNVYVDLSMLTEEERQAVTMEFSVNRRTSTDTYDPDCTNPSTHEYYGFTCYINSAQMSDTIEATLHYGDEQTVSGSTSVKDYVKYMVEHPNNYSEKAIALAKAIADYGHYMTPFILANGTGVESDTTIESYTDYTDADISEVKGAVAAKAISKTDEYAILTGTSYKLILGSETTITLYFKAAEGKIITGTDQIAVTKNGNTVSNAVVTFDGTRYCVRIPDINAAKLADDFTVTVTDSENHTATITVSALSYANTILTSEKYQNDTDSLYAMTSLYYYYIATKNNL